MALKFFWADWFLSCVVDSNVRTPFLTLYLSLSVSLSLRFVLSTPNEWMNEPPRINYKAYSNWCKGGTWIRSPIEIDLARDKVFAIAIVITHETLKWLRFAYQHTECAVSRARRTQVPQALRWGQIFILSGSHTHVHIHRFREFGVCFFLLLLLLAVLTDCVPSTYTQFDVSFCLIYEIPSCDFYTEYSWLSCTYLLHFPWKFSINNTIYWLYMTMYSCFAL